MTKILLPNDITLISHAKPERRRRRTLEPIVFARTTEDSWELYICVYREGEFRRIALSLPQARDFLASQLGNVTAALANTRDRHKPEEEKQP